MIRNFFKPVDSRRHSINLLVDDLNFDAQVARNEEEIESRQTAKRMRLAESRASNNRVRMEAQREGVERTESELVRDQIDDIVNDVDTSEPRQQKTVKTWSKRPANWMDIVAESNAFGSGSAIKNFPEEFIGLTLKASQKKVNRWQKNAKANKKLGSVRVPAYGTVIDDLVKQDFQQARDVGLPVDNVSLRRFLVVHLARANLLNTLVENGGPYSYTDSWAIRFYRRHNIASRVATTKMREIPADFEVKKEKYIKIAADLIYQYQVPPELVINGDETAVQLVSRANRTRNSRGAKRVRLLGMGEDKAQITTTIFVTESGGVLPFQMIFEGKTDRCHPKHAKPMDCVWTHTSSHWQSVATYLAVIEDIIVPYKDATIQRLGLNKKQVTILKHDLHFTHKDNTVLELLKKHHIVPLFVPAGCTDIIQECDTVVNKPFKNGVRNGYRDHMEELFQAHLRGGQPAVLFAPKLTMGALKPFLTGFVQRGIEAIKTPDMRAAIKNAFANDGLFSYIRSPEMQLSVQLEGVDLTNVFVPDVFDESNPSDVESAVYSDVGSDSGAD